MAQETLVFKVPAARHADLRQRLAAEDFDFRTIPHAVFSVRKEGIVATLYQSGKLVVQGREADWFADRFLDEADRQAPRPTKASEASEMRVEREMIGSDECGKGDYFGPLIACAVRLTPEEAEKLAAGKVADSKTLTDRSALQIGGVLREHVRYSLVQLEPLEYNAQWEASRNVNEVLADLHARAIRELYEPGLHVLIDRFATESLMAGRLRELDITLEQRPKAEANLAVATASIIAREQFLLEMNRLSDEYAIELHKGAGSPVDQAGVEFVKLHGHEKLREVAKVHFKNTSKIEDLLR